MESNKNHVYNEENGVLIPSDTTCEFCKSNSISDLNDCYQIPIYYVQNRTDVVIYNSVEYSSISYLAARCKSCHAIHNKSKKRAIQVSFVFFIIAIILIMIIFKHSSLFFTILVVGFVSVLLYLLMQGIFLTFYEKAFKLLSRNAIIKNSITIQNLIKDGWRMTKPKATLFDSLRDKF